MNVSFNFDDLKSKYGMFSDPRVALKINKRAFKSEEFAISDMRIELTSSFEANFAVFSVRSVVDEEARGFKEELHGLFDLGSRVDISAGYSDELEEVFTGFISGVTYDLPQDGFGVLNVQCMDVKGIMMNNNNYVQQKFKDCSACVQNLLAKSQYSGYYGELVVDRTRDDPKLIEITNESDYDFLVRVAKKINYEFFVSQDTVYFRKARVQNSSLATLSFGSGIEGINVSYSILGMVSSVEVKNTNTDTGELIAGEVKSSASYSRGSSASKVMKAANKVFLDSTVYSQEEAQRRAEAKLEDLNWKFGLANIHCVGLPELIPGRFVLVKNLFDDLDKKFYLTDVTHVIKKGNFATHVKARLKSL